MKKIIAFSLLFFPLISCSNPVTFSVNVYGESDKFTFDKKEERATLATAYELTIKANPGYEIIEDEQFIRITNKNFSEPLPPIRSGFGYWSYDNSSKILKISGTIINCDLNIGIYPDYDENLRVKPILGENYRNTLEEQIINPSVESVSYIIQPITGYRVPEKNNITITEGCDFEYTYTTPTDYAKIVLKREQCKGFTENITLTIPSAIKI